MTTEKLLAKGSVLRIEDGRGLLVSVSQGALWLTQEGDSRDHYIAEGAAFRLDRDGLALVSALGGTMLSLTPPARPRVRVAARLWRLGSQLFEPRVRPTTASL